MWTEQNFITSKASSTRIVIPAKAGIQSLDDLAAHRVALDPRLRGDAKR